MADDYANVEALAAQFQSHLGDMERQGGVGRGGGGPRGGGRGGRGGRRGGGGGDAQSRDRAISHALSRLLRHQAAAAGIELDAQGYARLDEVLAWSPLRSLGATVAEVRGVVVTNDKQRFRMRGEGEGEGSKDGPVTGAASIEEDPTRLYIRANQGHSIASVASDAGLLTPLTDAAAAPAVVCHGTYFAAWPGIEAAGGLHRMSRNHVHFGCLEGGQDEVKAIPGVRRDAQLHVFVDVRRALSTTTADSDPLRWWRAANGVVLTEGDADGRVPTRLFARVVVTAAGAQLLRKTGVRPVTCASAAVDDPSAASAESSSSEEYVLWQDGQKLAELPAEVLADARLPNGRRPAGGGRGGRRRGGRGGQGGQGGQGSGDT